MQDEKTLSVRQVTVFVFITAVAVKMFMLPSLLAAELGRNAYWAMLLYLAIDFSVLTLVVVAIRRAQCGFYELLEKTIGRILSRVVLGVSVLFLLFKLALMLGEVRIFFSERVFEDFGWSLYILPLLALMSFAAGKSLRILGRTAELVVPFILLSMALLFVLTAGKVDYSNLLPLFRDGGGDPIRYSLWLGDYSVLVLLVGKVDKGKAPAARWLIGGAIGSLCVEAFTIMICAAYGNLTHLLELGHNLGAMAQHSGTQNFGRLDLLVFTVWVATIVIKLLLYMYAVARHTAFVTTVDKPYIWALVASALIYVCSVFVLPSPGALYGVATGWMRCVALVEQFALPLITCIGALTVGRKRSLYEEE